MREDADLPLLPSRILRLCGKRTLGAQTGREGTALAIAGFLLRLYRHRGAYF